MGIDAVNSGSVASANSLTFSHTCSGTDRVLLVAIAHRGSITPVLTYNSVTMTEEVYYSSTTGRPIGVYSLDNPATGANNVFINWATNVALCAVSISLEDIAATGRLISTVKKADSGEPSTNAITPSDGDLILGFLANDNSAGALTEGTDQTLQDEIVVPDISKRASSKTAGGGSETMDWTGSSGKWSSVLLSFESSAAEVPGLKYTLKDSDGNTLNNQTAITAEWWNTDNSAAQTGTKSALTTNESGVISIVDGDLTGTVDVTTISRVVLTQGTGATRKSKSIEDSLIIDTNTTDESK